MYFCRTDYTSWNAFEFALEVGTSKIKRWGETPSPGSKGWLLAF